MKTNEINNNDLKKIIKAALENDYKVTKAEHGIYFDNRAVTPVRFKKGNMTGWDIINDLMKKANIQRGFYGEAGVNFSVFEDSAIIYDA